MTPRDFYSLLRGKLARKPDRNFDQRFWTRFESEFGATPSLKASRGSRFFSFRAGLLASATVAAAALALLLLIPGRLTRPHGDAGLAELNRAGDLALVSSLSQDAPFWENFELFETVGDLALSDQEWDELTSPDGPPPLQGDFPEETS